MKYPKYTCPDKEEIEKVLKEFADCSVVNDEIDTLANKLKSEYKAQYDYYADEILDKLEDYKKSCERLRDYCDYQEKRIEDLEKEIKELNNKSE